MRVSVIIPTRNGASYLAATLQPILEQDVAPDTYEVIVVDNGSDDDSFAVLESMRERYSHLRLEREPIRGPGAARNCGIRLARYELLLFLDDDISVEPEHIRRHVEYHLAADSALCVVNAVANQSSSEWPPLDVYLKQRADAEAQAVTGGHPGLALISQDFSIRREVLDRVRFEANGREQYFDEYFVMRQDGELGIRLEKAGVKFRFVHDVPARHVQTYTRAQMQRRSEKAGYYTYMLFARHPGLNAPIPFRRLDSPVVRRLVLAAGHTLIALGRLLPGFGRKLTVKGVGAWLTYYLNTGYFRAKADAAVHATASPYTVAR